MQHHVGTKRALAPFLPILDLPKLEASQAVTSQNRSLQLEANAEYS